MGRIRSVKPSLYTHEEMNALEDKHTAARPMLTFIGLFLVADKCGRFAWSAPHLKLSILPFVPGFDLGASLDLLESRGFIRSYMVEGKRYGFIPTWHLHQRITGKEAMSPPRYPDPALGEPTGKQPGNNRETTEKAQVIPPAPLVQPQAPPAPEDAPPAKRKRKPRAEPPTLLLPPDLEPWFSACWWDLYPEQVICEGQLVPVERGLKAKAREAFKNYAAQYGPIAIYLAFRAYLKGHKKVKEGYIQEFSTFLGPKKATVKDYLEIVLPYMETHPSLKTMAAPPESEEALRKLIEQDEKVPEEAHA